MITVKEENQLFPVFLKLEEMPLLIVGGGKVAHEKLVAVLTHSPLTPITLVASQVSSQVKELAFEHPNLLVHERAFTATDLEKIQLVICAINDKTTAKEIRALARQKGLLVNVADTPELCDFYLGAIVKKGNLKIAISTNGKSPTMAKRLKETLAETLPDELDEVLDNMHHIRNNLQGDFSGKVKQLNDITSILSGKQEHNEKFHERRWKKAATWILFAFLFMILGHTILSYVPAGELWSSVKDSFNDLDPSFKWMVLTGFCAQLIDGLLGMGYGLTCTTVLLSLGIGLPAISGSIHTAEMFSSGISGYTHYRFGNINKKLFYALLIPGILGAIAGAVLLSVYGETYAVYIKPVLATYTLLLGLRILVKAFKKKRAKKKTKHVSILAGVGGFLDSFAGGGWGPLVTSTLISGGRTPKYVIGSVSATEFFVTLVSALTFFTLLGLGHWQVIVGLILGGGLAAPLAARLSGKLPLKFMFLGVGALAVIWSLRILLKSLWG